jgi:hypothetical protein
MGGQAQTASAIQSAGGGPEAIIIYDKSSSPSADDYIIDVDYPMDLSRRSSTCWGVAESEA